MSKAEGGYLHRQRESVCARARARADACTQTHKHTWTRGMANGLTLFLNDEKRFSSVDIVGWWRVV
jgi:hypothetical protein